MGGKKEILHIAPKGVGTFLGEICEKLIRHFNLDQPLIKTRDLFTLAFVKIGCC